jgi:hypothetical protein
MNLVGRRGMIAVYLSQQKETSERWDQGYSDCLCGCEFA